MKRKLFFIRILTFYLICGYCFAADVIFIDLFGEESTEKMLIKFACKYYGLDIKPLILVKRKECEHLSHSFDYNDPLAIIISAHSLSAIDKGELLSMLKDKEGNHVPLLIIGINSDVDSMLLQKWSGGAIKKCINFNNTQVSRSIRISNLKDIVFQLAGLKILSITKSINYFFCDNSRIEKSIIQISDNNTEHYFPIFIKTIVDGKEVYILAKNQLVKAPSKLSKRYNNKTTLNYKSIMRNDEYILELLPLMMFLKYTCGDFCWHSPVHFANLTIDDPWLTEPYGHLSYRKLLKEMERVNFHTSVAFIPWNYDRSKLDVVSLFHNNPERLSICIHGNNHDHYEFYKYETGPGDPWPAKPLNAQEANIKQALARMERFRSMTGISYDKVMVFPHSIAPVKTLGLLKKYNFLATVNAENVPLGSYEPKDSSFFLRPVTLTFENFSSLKRYSPNRTQVEIAIDLFLDNPIIFYAHHDFFQNGIDAFDKTANMVNEIQPDIIWQSLGYIAQHLYLEKLRDDGNYDVLAFLSNFIIESTYQHDLTYFVRKEEDFSIPIKQVTVDGQPFSYKKYGNNLILEVFVPAGESRNVVIEYENSLDISSVDVSKNDPCINRLRKLSDFRDIKLSKNVFGRVFTRVYYDTRLYKFGLIRLAVILLIFFVLVIIISFLSWRIIRSRKTGIKI